MITLGAVNGYLGANVLLALGTALLAGISRVSARLALPFLYQQLLRVGYVIAAVAVLVPFSGLKIAGHDAVIPPAVDVWAVGSVHERLQGVDGQQVALAAGPRAHLSVSLVAVQWIASGLLLLGVAAVLASVAREVRAVIAVVRGGHWLRKTRGAGILVSERIKVPFSFWWPGCCLIVIPAELLVQPRELRMAIRHEAQHHRQADTRIAYLCQAARAVFFWNPAVHSLIRQILELQEFACDESIVSRSRGCAPEYCRCLLWVAEAALERAPGALRINMAGRNPKLLVRRVEALQAAPAGLCRSWIGGVVAVSAAAMLTSLSLAVTAPVNDRRIGLDDAQRMVRIARQTSEFPLTLNERVLDQLNLLLGTPDGRTYLRESLDRMQRYGTQIGTQLRRSGLPDELTAVPVVESGYRNLPQDPDRLHGAGLWMFIESTARRFGLQVTARNDQRLGIPEETAAAVRLLGSLRNHFQDWNLALLAFNIGEDQVDQGMRATGSRDAWRLIASGYENDPDYLPRVVAVMVIIKNPAVLDP